MLIGAASEKSKICLGREDCQAFLHHHCAPPKFYYGPRRPRSPMLKFPKAILPKWDADAFESRIRPDMEQRRYLRSCVKDQPTSSRESAAATKTVLGMDRSVTPRFRTQGSWSYDTCVVPAMMPPRRWTGTMGSLPAGHRVGGERAAP